MKRLGIIGGISWHSTAKYYEQLNEGVQRRRGGHHSADILLNSLNFAEVEAMQRANDWRGLDELMAQSAQALARGGAQGLLIGANTMHKCAPAVRTTGLPLLHIGDAIAADAKSRGLNRLGLLGTRFTMAESFLSDAIETHGLAVEVPDARGQSAIDNLIFDELVHGTLGADANQHALAIIQGLRDQGCEGVVLGCTELGIPRWDQQCDVPLIDSQKAHVDHALTWMLD